MRPLGDMPFSELLAAVAARTPAPGGGAVACAAGALAAALARMVVSYSLGRKDPAIHRAELEQADGALAGAADVLLELADEDAAAYAQVNELLRLPDADARRTRELPAAAARAVQVPLATLAACSNMLRLLEENGSAINRRLASDWAIAAILAQAGAEAAAWNVRVNLPLLPDAARRADAERECARLVAESAERRVRVERACSG